MMDYKMILTLEKLIEEIRDRKQQALDNLPYMANKYSEGYYDALGELVEFIEDNT